MASEHPNRQLRIVTDQPEVVDPEQARFDDLWATIAGLFGEPVTANQRSYMAKQVRELHSVGATAADVEARCLNLVARWGDGKYLTLGSLMKHWTDGLIDQLTPDTIARAQADERYRTLTADTGHHAVAASRFIRELETAFAEQLPRHAAEWLVDRITAMQPTDTALAEAATAIERHDSRLPRPAAITESVATAMRREARHQTPAVTASTPQKTTTAGGDRESGTETGGPLSDLASPVASGPLGESGIDLVRRLHASRAGCHSSTCDIHHPNTNQENTDHDDT